MPNENTHKYANGLANEKSPYLLQHDHNPVGLYQWSDFTFVEIKEEICWYSYQSGTRVFIGATPVMVSK